jgi:hypothetical protein
MKAIMLWTCLTSKEPKNSKKGLLPLLPLATYFCAKGKPLPQTNKIF